MTGYQQNDFENDVTHFCLEIFTKDQAGIANSWYFGDSSYLNEYQNPVHEILLIMTTVILYLCQDSGEKPETMTGKDAAMFPIIASCTLFGIYIIFKVSIRNQGVLSHRNVHELHRFLKKILYPQLYLPRGTKNSQSKISVDTLRNDRPRLLLERFSSLSEVPSVQLTCLVKTRLVSHIF